MLPFALLLSMAISAPVLVTLPVTLPVTLLIDAATLAALSRATARLTAHGKTQSCKGVWLADLAFAAGLPAGNAIQGPALQTLIVAEAAGGYRVVFSLGEIDAKLGNRQVPATALFDGQKLSAEDGPLRLVIPGGGARRAAGTTVAIPACGHPALNDRRKTDQPAWRLSI